MERGDDFFEGTEAGTRGRIIELSGTEFVAQRRDLATSCGILGGERFVSFGGGDQCTHRADGGRSAAAAGSAMTAETSTSSISADSLAN